jgi:pSer/pThr/pTyr-binding forkhead associated (FHA) protein
VLNKSVSWAPALIVDGKRISLKTGVTTVGREDVADIAIDDRGLSRIHFEIAWNGEVAAIRDRQSTNGTFVDDARISEVVLRSGNVIKAGRSEFEFELSANAQVDA